MVNTEVNLGWKTERCDLVEAVRRLPIRDTLRLLVVHMKGDPRAGGLTGMRHEQQANLLMLGLLEGKVPESAVLPCAPQE